MADLGESCLSLAGSWPTLLAPARRRVSSLLSSRPARIFPFSDVSDRETRSETFFFSSGANTSSRRHVVTSSRRQARDVLDHHRIFEPNCPLLPVTCPYPYLQSTKRAKMTTDIDMTNANGALAGNGVHIDEVRGVGDRLADFSDLVRPPSRAPLSRYSLVCTRACLSSTRTYTLASWRSMARRACVAWPPATC